MAGYQSPLPEINVTSPYGKTRTDEVHQGVDLGAPAGTPISNMSDGTVVSTTSGYGGGYGNSVLVDYGDGVTARFAHMQTPPYTIDAQGKQVLLQPGTKIKSGALLGNVGSTGRSTGPHLHLQMAQDGNSFNPMDAIYNNVSPPPISVASTVDQTSKQIGTSGQPGFKHPSKNVVKAAGLGSIARDKDADLGLLTDWDTPQDPHESYYAAAELIIGDVVICPLSPDPVSTEPPTDPNVVVDNETQGSFNDLRLEEFQYRSQTLGSGNTILVRLFVKSWSDVVQIMALAAQNQEAKVRYGYLNLPDGLVGPIPCQVLRITPEFLENGFTVVVELMDHDAYTNLSAGAKTFDWQAESGRISDIVKYIANQNGWRTCIEPTVAGDPFQTYPQNQQTDLNFMNTVLAPKSRSAEARDIVKTEDGVGYGPYVAYLHSANPNDSDKTPILHFHPRLPAVHNTQAATPVRDYVWGGVQDGSKRQFGTVVSFNASFDNTAFLMLGGGNLKVLAVDVTKKIVNQVTAFGSDFDDRQLGQSEGPIDVNMSSQDPTRSEHRHEHELEFLKSVAAARFFVLREYALQASMTVLGDPYMRAGIVVNVLVVRPNDGSIMMYDWFVSEAVHTITGGEYLLNYSLSRTLAGPVARPGDENLPGLGVGAGHYNQRTFIEPSSNGISVGTNAGSPADDPALKDFIQRNIKKRTTTASAAADPAILDFIQRNTKRVN